MNAQQLDFHIKGINLCYTVRQLCDTGILTPTLAVGFLVDLSHAERTHSMEHLDRISQHLANLILRDIPLDTREVKNL